MAWLSDLILRAKTTKKQLFTPSPRTTVIPGLSEKEAANLPYPVNALPGGRDVATPYGSIRVYEWGPEDGEKILFVHGITTPTVLLGDLGHDLVDRGYRVMLFDLFGRGYSDAPTDLDYDVRLYVSQILLVLASSKLPWSTFHLVGYSLGGGLCASFATYFPHLLSSLTVIAGCGFIRPHHVGWQSRFLYSSGLLPESLVKVLVQQRIRPSSEEHPPTVGGGDILSAETKKSATNVDHDCNGGDGFDSAVISKSRPGVTVSSVVGWQVDHHEGFVHAFLSTMRNAPIYAPQENWETLAAMLEARRRSKHVEEAEPTQGLTAGKVLFVLAEDDSVVVKDETIQDARRVLGLDGADFAVLPGGHEVPITGTSMVADAMERFWRKY
ncbi:hypothetical protein M426DRAFT_319372 [Hypoxylon sp. CI-4A]|nr:hypothetical protein M426DRAFT_319372 [Hypoxylon sp. CI-4A]